MKKTTAEAFEMSVTSNLSQDHTNPDDPSSAILYIKHSSSAEKRLKSWLPFVYQTLFTHIFVDEICKNSAWETRSTDYFLCSYSLTILTSQF